MALLGSAALAMWWDIAPAVRADFEEWHAREHFPERLALPGFRRGTRWRIDCGVDSGGEGEGMFVLYELERHEALASPEYLARLNAPTAWSTRLMPHHRHMVRAQCRVVASCGAVVAGHALTARLAADPGRDDALHAHLAGLVAVLAQRPGVAGAHLLRHDAPALAATKEQAIRGHADRAADWILVVCAYRRAALESIAAGPLAPATLAGHGASPDRSVGVYALAVSATPADIG
jgi:hypothetical protein